MNFIEKRLRKSELYKLGFEEGKESLISKVHEYLDIIKSDNTAPEYRWNKESHGVLGFFTLDYRGEGK
jgi:hypothetical protein